MSQGNFDPTRQYYDDRVRVIVEGVFGRPIASVTWNRWKRFVGVPPREFMFNEFEVKCLILYADMKKEKPRQCYVLSQITDTLKNLDNQSFKFRFSQAVKSAGTIKGYELQDVLKNKLGRPVALSNLYYWGKKNSKLTFGLHQTYSYQDIEEWVKIASKHAPKTKSNPKPKVIDLHKPFDPNKLFLEK